MAVARETGTPLTMRGAGTSIAGNAIGAGIVIDTSKHLNRVLSIDPEARTAHVQPGAVHAALQKHAVPLGLRFGPDPSTHTRCTIGGMIGNNACGSRALAYGRTVDNVAGPDGAPGRRDGGACRGASVVEEARNEPSRTARSMRWTLWSTSTSGTARTEFGRFGRQVSGYSSSICSPSGADGSTGSWSDRGHAGGRPRRHRAPGRGRSGPRLVVLGYPSWPLLRTPYPPCCSIHWSPAKGSTSASPGWCSSHPSPPCG